jgi:hypothetical protein
LANLTVFQSFFPFTTSSLAYLQSVEAFILLAAAVQLCFGLSAIVKMEYFCFLAVRLIVRLIPLQFHSCFNLPVWLI